MIGARRRRGWGGGGGEGGGGGIKHHITKSTYRHPLKVSVKSSHSSSSASPEAKD